MLKKLASRKHAKDRVVAFVVTVRALEPWARGARPRHVCIGWERGASRRGTTALREASIVNDGANARYAFEESFTIEATMQKTGKGRAYKPKGLTFFVLALPENAERGTSVETQTVGGCSVDLARFVECVDGVTEFLDVDCADDVRRAVGTPRLMISVRSSGLNGTATHPGYESDAVSTASHSMQAESEQTVPGYQWAASRFQTEPSTSVGAGQDEVAALTSMASMFKKRGAVEEDTDASEERVEPQEPSRPVEFESAEAVEARSELFGAARAQEQPVEEPPPPPEEDPELDAARNELFGAFAPQEQPVSPRAPQGTVDSDGFLLDSDLESDVEAEEAASEFTQPPAADAFEKERVAAEEARAQAEEDALAARIEADRKRTEEEESARAQEAQLQAQRMEEERIREEEEKRFALIEAERIKAEEEARRLAEESSFAAHQEEEGERRRVEEEAMQAAQAEEERRLAEEEAMRFAQAEEERRLAEEEAMRVAQAEERRLAEEEAMRVAQAEEERRLAEEEAMRVEQAEEERRLAQLRAEEERLWALEAEAERKRLEEVEKSRVAQEAADAARAEEERIRMENVRIAEHEARLQEEREQQMEANAKAAERDVDAYAEAVLAEEANTMLFSDSPSEGTTRFRTPMGTETDAFYTPATRRTRFADSLMKPSVNRLVEDEIVSMSISDVLIHGVAENIEFTTALSLQERIAAVRGNKGLDASQLEFNRIMDAFGVAITGAMSNPARLLFLCAQLIALRVSLATMDDIETRDVLELEVLARNCAFDSLWSTTFGAALCPSEATLGLLNLKTHLNGDGERIGRAWAALFQFAKARLGYDAVANAEEKGNSTKPLLAELQLDILRDLILRLDEAVLNILINPTGDERVNVMIPGGGALTFAAGAELKRAISALVSAAKELNIAGTPETIIPKLRATADVCMIPKDALVDSKLRADIVGGKITAKELAAVVSRFRPDDFAPQPVDPDVISAVVAAAANDDNSDENASNIEPFVPVSTSGAPWVANLARALAEHDSASLSRRVPGPSAHASRWSIVADVLNGDDTA